MMVFMLIAVCFSFFACQRAPAVVSEVITFKVLITDPNARVVWGMDEVSKRIMRETNVKLDIEILQTDLSTKIDSMILKNEYPDMLLSIDNDAVSRLIKADALQPLDDYLNDGGENIKAVFGSDLDNMRSNIDGKIYGFNREHNAISSFADANFFVQYEVLKDAGYPDLTNMTLAKLSEILDNYAKKYPFINGHKTIGLSAYGDDYGMNITFNNPALKVAGYQNDGNYAVDDDNNVSYGMRLDSSGEFFKWLNQMNRDGLFDGEAVIQKRSSFVEKVSQGNVLAVLTEPWDIDDSESALRKKNLNNRCYAPVPVRLSKDTDISNICNYSSLGTWKSVITKQTKHKKKAFEFVDAMWSEKMQILANWGVEGIHYDIINGKRQLRPDVIVESKTNPDWKSDLGIMIYNMFSCGSNVLDSTGQYIVPFTSSEFLYQTYDKETTDFLKQYNKKSFKEFFPAPKKSKTQFVWKLDLPTTTNGAIAEAEINNKIRRIYIPKLVLCSPNNYDSVWLEFQNKIDETLIDEREDEIKHMLWDKSV